MSDTTTTRDVEPETLAVLTKLGVRILVPPFDDRHRRDLLAQRHPCLIVLDELDSPPDALSPLEEWVRRPVHDDEIIARARYLNARAATFEQPFTLEHGVLHLGNDSIILSPHEGALLGALLEAAGRVVNRAALTTAVWPDGPPATERALDGLIKSLRNRLRGSQVEVHTVRGRGHYASWSAR